MSARTFTRTFAVCLGFAILAAWSVSADDPKPQPKAEAKRKPWTTSKVTGSPEPPPKFRSARAFPPGVKFNHPDLIAACPGTDRLFVGEQEGMLYSLKPGPGASKDVFLDLKKDYKALKPHPRANGIGELYGLVFHPKFEENRYCYVCYTLSAKERPKDGRFPDGSRVSRFTVPKADPPRIDVASEEVILTFVGGGHNGGDLHFGPDGMLYVTTGDAASPNPPDPLNTGQDCSDLLGSLLRIDVNKKDEGKSYAVPPDNPFVGMKDVRTAGPEQPARGDGIRPEIWAFGFRNPWRMSFDRQTGDLWLGDVGWELWEMVHKIEKGGNYGWSITEGPQPIKPTQKIGPTPIRPATIEISHTIGTSVTGGYVYRGKKFPELVGAYVFGDWETRRIWAARFADGRLKEMPEIVKPNIRVSAFGEDNAGELYYAEYDSGEIYTLERNDAAGANTNFPKTLSATGLFKDAKALVPADGVVSFRPNTRQWQDGATAEYLLALPGISSVAIFDKPRPLPGQVFWHNFRTQFPADAVLVKTIMLDTTGGKKRVETQILHCDGEDWRGYTYAWRDDQTDAELVPADGAEKVFTVSDGRTAGGRREQVWAFHSRNQCMSCHNSWAEYALAFNPPQLNDHRTAGGAQSSQLVRLSHEGYLRRVGEKDQPLPGFDEKLAAKEPALVPPSGAEPLEQRARSYLHANCAHCHRFGGGGGQVVLELDFQRPLKEAGILDVPPKQGDFGIPNARLVSTRGLHESVLYYRMAKFGRGRMPHLGSEWPDPVGTNVVGSWISQMAGFGPTAFGILRPSIDNLEPEFTGVGLALRPAAILRSRDDAERPEYLERIRGHAAKLEPGPVRDLFEGYLPQDPKGRKLGSNPRPESILKLAGDAKKGEVLFFAKDVKCATCHKVGDKGVSLGPDLSTIGKTRTRAELLGSILQPSARVEPQFAAYLVRTKDEQAVTGLLVKRDDKQVVVRDAENKEHTFAAADVEAVTPSRLSLMPDGQMSGLTPQEAADLLEYLVQRK